MNTNKFNEAIKDLIIIKENYKYKDNIGNILYLCDKDKNIICPKISCQYLCFFTTFKEFAYNPDN